ncbi:MAG: hypothetical protein A3F72_12140 [Bacteroidetes bacterium RIFCSPLOWO2_12_FULL_35_15]|nr:MAG: hypothetical protein A3F72_12140 [Bacteroidetes bacterium RIFCSPLOWO2_12_FULL_35_15]
MKNYILAIICSIQITNLFCQTPPWPIVVDKTPVIRLSEDSVINDTVRFNFSLPDNPTVMDTLNIKHYSMVKDSSLFFHILKFTGANLDSSNTTFTNALQLTQGDTLSAIVNSFIGSTNSSQTEMNTLALSSGYKGLEMNLTYNDLYTGRIVLSYTRIYYKPKSLLTFMIAGFQDDLTNLTANKNTFFNSITLGSSNY